MEQLRNGSIDVTADDFPSFLYIAYNADDPEETLLRGPFLLKARERHVVLLFIASCRFRSSQVFKHIFTAPASVTSSPGHRKSRANNAELSNVTKVTPRTIAYSTCQVCGIYSPLYGELEH